jgi:putative membrane protein insertion efficiency factor
MTRAGKIAVWLVKVPILIYRYTLSAFFGRECRFLPTCSEYALEAVDRHGAIKGGLLALRRIARCHPWGGSGYDPVPESISLRPFAIIKADDESMDKQVSDTQASPAKARTVGQRRHSVSGGKSRDGGVDHSRENG